MELNPVGCHTRLAVEEVEEADATHPNRHTRGLEAPGCGELRIKLAARALNRCEEQTAGCAGWIRDLGDHRVSRTVLNHQVIIAIGLQLVFDQGCVY